MGIQTSESNKAVKKKYRLGYDYLFLPSEEHAMAAIQSYWRAIKELNQLGDVEHSEKIFLEEHAN